MENTLLALRAIAEPTRLRLLALCAQGDLAVSELVGILGQSQPRVSRHLKLLCDAGLIERKPEGAWVFYRLAGQGPNAGLARAAIDSLPADAPPIAGDMQRLAAHKQARAAAAAAYFRNNAGRWAELRSLHVDETIVEKAIIDAFAGRRIGALLDIGTGTGRMLELLGPKAQNAIGVDSSRDMLAIARTRLEAVGLDHCRVRQADMYALPFADGSFDSIIIHQVLHFAEHPARAVAEAARLLKSGGLLVIVDFAPHTQESLRIEHRHHRLGFAAAEIAGWCAKEGLTAIETTLLPGRPLTVIIWRAAFSPPAQSSGDQR